MAERAIRVVAIPKSLHLARARLPLPPLAPSRSALARATLNLPRVHFPYRFFPSPLLVVPILLFFVLCEAQPERCAACKRQCTDLGLFWS